MNDFGANPKLFKERRLLRKHAMAIIAKDGLDRAALIKQLKQVVPATARHTWEMPREHSRAPGSARPLCSMTVEFKRMMA